MKQAAQVKPTTFIMKGDICYSTSLTDLVTMENSYIVCIDGKSKGVYQTLPSEYQTLPIHDYTGRLIIPGLVDLHIHAPQYAFRGLGMDMELMEWLQKQTFPQEAKYADLEYAKKAYAIFVEQMKKSATTHACIFSTRHRPATELLMDMLEESGLVTYVGKVNMDREAPEELCEPDAEHSAEETIQWLENIRDKYRHTKPILTPRFIPCCTEELLERLQKIQKDYDLPVQSHLSENPGEVSFVGELCPDADFYGDAYDRHGLFGKNNENNKFVKTIMAHCVYSTAEEIQRLYDNQVFVAHCPASNVNLSSGIAPVRKYLTAGLKIGLGSDVAGGHTESMFRAITDVIQMSKLYWRLVDQSQMPLNFKEAFYLATKGGGEFFGNVGSFEEDYDFSAVVLEDSVLRYPYELSLQERLERAAYQSLDLYGICGKYVTGRKVI